MILDFIYCKMKKRTESALCPTLDLDSKPTKYVHQKWLSHHAALPEVSSCQTRDESEQSFAGSRWRMQESILWFWNPGQELLEVQNRGVSDPAKMTDVLQNIPSILGILWCITLFKFYVHQNNNINCLLALKLSRINLKQVKKHVWRLNCVTGFT